MDRPDLELGFDAGAFALDVLGCPEAVDQDVGALLGQGPGDGQADAAGGAGDDGRAGLQDHAVLRAASGGDVAAPRAALL